MSRNTHVLDPRAFRQRAGISLRDIAESTKISVRFLEAIEAGEFDQLPGGIFSISYLRQYAAATGYDASRLLDAYRSSTSDGETDAGIAVETAPRKRFVLTRLWVSGFTNRL